MQEGGAPVLEMKGIVKTFASQVALDGVDLCLRAGQVHALVGENGAGKSTLIKIMTGAYRRDGGTMCLLGRPVEFRSPEEAQTHGVVAVYQEINLLLSLTVAENINLGREPRRFGLIDWKRMNDSAEQVLRRLNLAIHPTAPLGSLTIAVRQLVAIARSVSLGAKVVVLDEPTSSLTEREVAILYAAIRTLREKGVAVLYISHRLDELYAVCDRVTVLRDGKRIMTCALGQLGRRELVCAMLGKRPDELEKFASAAPHPKAAAATAPRLSAEQLSTGPKLRDATVAVQTGEIVGIAGLLGSGRSELLRALFGLAAKKAGAVKLRGRDLDLRSPRDAIAAGLALLPEDRKLEGIIPELSVAENLTLAALPELARFGVVARARQREVVLRYMKQLRIKAASADQKLRELSGGNQQKVLLARWLCRGSRLLFLLLDEPTRGIDVGARAEIQALIRELAAAGLGVLMVSSELEELLTACSRVMVLKNGCSVAELDGAALTQSAIIAAMAEGGAAEPALALEGA